MNDNRDHFDERLAISRQSIGYTVFPIPLPFQMPKPHIYFRGGVWWCVEWHMNDARNRFFGHGRTQAEAFWAHAAIVANDIIMARRA